MTRVTFVKPITRKITPEEFAKAMGAVPAPKVGSIFELVGKARTGQLDKPKDQK